jgi:uncharacterized phage protein (TIGR01671 family)
MKTIKFRRAHFYDAEKTKFSHFTYWGVGKEINMKEAEFTSPSTNNFAIYYTDCQLTGLEDKNKKEYYEGDIAEMEAAVYYDEGSFIVTFIGEVTVIPSVGVCLKNPQKYRDGYEPEKRSGYKKLVGYRSKKIGNIYENPELLNEEK